MYSFAKGLSSSRQAGADGYGAMKIIALCLLFACASPAFGADANGHFIVGGGVGQVTCASFLDAMATARQLGGAKSVAGANKLNAYANYVLGFQTAYNFSTPGVTDVFSEFGPSPSNDVLFAIEPWCRDHPAAKFGDALVVFVRRIAKPAQ